MRYFVACVFLFCCSATSVFAQQSVGFSNPDNIESLLDYRLPDWGYSNFSLDFDARGSGSDFEGRRSESGGRRGDFNIGPTYRLFRESEERTFQFNSSMMLGYLGRNQNLRSNFSNTESEYKDQDFDIGLSVSTTIKEYVSSQSFIFGDGTINLNYRSTKTESFEDETLNDKRVAYNHRFSATPRIGYGFGRLRNVNPIIRAVRLSERASVIKGTMDFSRQEIQAAADQFTRYDGYQQTYDRPQKYFWDDMDEAMAPDLSSLNTFDMLYLTDVLDEGIGTRLEGWEVIGGAQFSYQNNLERIERPFNQFDQLIRDELISKRAGVFVNGRWYKNTSLTQQWGITGKVRLSYPLGNQTGYTSVNRKWGFSFRTGVNYLWNITDRFLFRSELNNLYSRSMLQESSIGGGTDYYQWFNRLMLDNNFSYFVENRLALTLSLKSRLSHNGNTQSDATLEARRFNWSAGLGLRYYFSRNLY